MFFNSWQPISGRQQLHNIDFCGPNARPWPSASTKSCYLRGQHKSCKPGFKSSFLPVMWFWAIPASSSELGTLSHVNVGNGVICRQIPFSNIQSSKFQLQSWCFTAPFICIYPSCRGQRVTQVGTHFSLVVVQLLGRPAKPSPRAGAGRQHAASQHLRDFLLPRKVPQRIWQGELNFPPLFHEM